MIKERVSKYVKLLYKYLFILVGILPKQEKVIVFESFLGKQYSCNPRAIYEYITENYPDYQCYWSYDPRYVDNFTGYNLNLVKRFSVKWLLIMPSAKYWVSNSRLPAWTPKPAKTIYLQTWHGTPLKKLGVDIEEIVMPGTTTEKYKKNFIMESSRWDYLISPNKYSSEIFRGAFRFNKQMIESGYPRNDFLYTFKPADVAKIRKQLSIPTDKKVILYAPTWRDNEYHSKGKYKFSLTLDLQALKRQVGDEYIVLLRLHYLISDNLDLSEYKGFVIDASNHSDIRELYIISDLLITDYSSVFFDYANLNRPMIFYVYDIDSYRDQLRGFYFDFEKEAPGPLVKTTTEVISAIKKISDSNNKNLVPELFLRKFTALEDGHAAKRVVEKLLGVTKK
ncbi:CDP-glycerol glycerophosphotransferase family protein [Bacillaceae bacterium IKA-2]|nr:CDP-glycerol glycerophosphotransferase family protein [Bacillaceae bacterium IKA-2]